MAKNIFKENEDSSEKVTAEAEFPLSAKICYNSYGREEVKGFRLAFEVFGTINASPRLSTKGGECHENAERIDEGLDRPTAGNGCKQVENRLRNRTREGGAWSFLQERSELAERKI